MVHVVGAGSANVFTWHSSRIYLATHLMRCNVPTATIQAMLRWQTDESLRAYARLDMAASGNMLGRAAAVKVAAIQTGNLPIYERFDFFLALDALADAA
jgi:hypothetical protein